MRRWIWLILAGAVLLLGWRPPAREPDALALVRVLGIDGSGPVELTAVCGGEDQEDQGRGQCAGEDLRSALERLPWSGTEELSCTSVSYLLVGRDVDLEEVLLAVLQNEELGASAAVWLADGGAAALLDGCEDPAAALDLLARQGVAAPTAVQALAAVYRDGGVELPLLSEDGGSPVWLGWEEWRGEK